MDPYSDYQKRLDYYDYLEKQQSNPVDLTADNNCIKSLADKIFTKKPDNLERDLTGILFDDSMEIADLFCMLVELLLYGYDILTSKNILDLDSSVDDIVYLIKPYFKSFGVEIIFDEDFFVEADRANLYRDRTDYYCEIVSKPPIIMLMDDWTVLDYRLINNKQFVYDKLMPLEKYRAFFINSSKKVLLVWFRYIGC